MKKLICCGYRIDETRSDDKTVYAFYGCVAGKSGYTQIAFSAKRISIQQRGYGWAYGNFEKRL